MEFSWMWYLDWILDGCYYPRVIGHFKKLYFDQQVYLAVTAFHGGIPPKKLQPIFCSHIKFEFFNCNVDPLYACRKYFKRSRKSSFLLGPNRIKYKLHCTNCASLFWQGKCCQDFLLILLCVLFCDNAFLCILLNKEDEMRWEEYESRKRWGKNADYRWEICWKGPLIYNLNIIAAGSTTRHSRGKYQFSKDS